MPNHCSNDLRITGSPKLIDLFFETVKGPEKLIDASKIIPYPKKFADADARAEEARKKTGEIFTDVADGYNNGGYEWCCKHWGTKWGLYNFTEVKRFKRSAVVTFDTAWSPPSPIIKEASNRFPQLTFLMRSYECGCGYKAILEVKAGIVLTDQTLPYNGSRGG